MDKTGNPKFRTSLSAAVMFLENSSQNEKKIPCSPILGHFFLVDDKIMSIGTASALVLYTKIQHFVWWMLT